MFSDRSLESQYQVEACWPVIAHLIRPMNWFPASSRNDDERPGTTAHQPRTAVTRQQLTQNLVKQKDEFHFHLLLHRVAHAHPSWRRQITIPYPPRTSPTGALSGNTHMDKAESHIRNPRPHSRALTHSTSLHAMTSRRSSISPSVSTS